MESIRDLNARMNTCEGIQMLFLACDSTESESELRAIHQDIAKVAAMINQKISKLALDKSRKNHAGGESE